MTIHLITAGKYQNQNNWPEIWDKCFNSLAKTKNDINIWDDEGIDKLLQEDDNEFYKHYLNKLAPVYKWDYVRYNILEHYGGAYMDMDIEIIQDFFPMLDKNKIYMMEGDIGELYNNCLMISPNNKKTQEVWRTIRLFVKQRIIDNFELCKDKYNVMRMVGPYALSEWFAKYFQEFTPLKVGVLSKYHFSQVDSDISFSKHYQTSIWNNK